MHWILTLVKLGNLYTTKTTNPDVVVVRADALNDFKCRCMLGHRVLFIDLWGSWSSMAIFQTECGRARLPLTWFMVGRGNVFFTYTEETQYPVSQPDPHPVVIHTYQTHFWSVCHHQTSSFDFNVVQYVWSSLKQNCNFFPQMEQNVFKWCEMYSSNVQ